MTILSCPPDILVCDIQAPMGCGSSSNGRNLDSPEFDARQFEKTSGEPLVDAFQRLDTRISALENMCPGPRLATAEAWVEFLQGRFDIEGEEIGEIEIVDSYDSQKIVETEVKDIAKLSLQLGIVSDVKKAVAQEDFFANISRAAIETISRQFYSEILDMATMRAKHLLDNYSQLSALYAEQDGLIATFNGGVYTTLLEETLDTQLESARDVRDKLGSAMEQWRTCALLLKASAKSASKALEAWKKVQSKISEKDKITNALECRQAVQASLISFECAQLSLPNVDLKFVTKRQILAVRHANVYLLTDIVDNIRYLHTTKIFDAYNNNLTKSVDWLFGTYADSLRKDFTEAEKKVRIAANRLREHRIEIFLDKYDPQSFKTKSKLDNG